MQKGITVRIITGYLLILLLIPAFITVVTLTYTEAGNAVSFSDTLDQNIDLTNTKLSQTSRILANNGEVITEIHRPMNRSYAGGHEIPDFIKEVFIVSEDRNFEKHPGFDLPAIGRALAINIHSDDIEQGASTITQQLARNQYLNHQKSYNRKLSEVLYAYQLEKTFSKAEILEQYLNAIYFHNNAYGIKAAADFYFKKAPMDLSEAEQAFLAAIPNNPSYYDPIQHFERTKKRQERLLEQLAQHGKIKPASAQKLKHEKIILKVESRKNSYPDYTSYALHELRELISEKENLNDSDELTSRMEELLRSGVVIHTNLDIGLQKRTVKAVKTHLQDAKVQGAATVVNHETGQIVAVAGGKDYRIGDFNRAYQAFRQPGSSIKPLLVYAPYFERFDANEDSQVNAGPLCIKGYCPKNYGGSNYGMVPLEKAFIHSYNTPAVRLLQQVGTDEAFSDLAPFQFEKVTAQDHVLAAAVGGFTTGVSPLEMTSAYTVFSNKGLFLKPRAISNVIGSDGEVLYKWNDEPAQVWNPSTAEKVRSLMQKTVASGTARKAAGAGPGAGGKTGTTNDFKDFWFIGFNGPYSAGVWVGKDKPQSMEHINQQSPHLLIWRDIMKK
ncbi:penicillin-binding protein [Mesobacillus subterraneus]|uniref:transglycosylase domain-containing protein n=1 Tax=Mesobacillus subterraneus TaxID=285983 RepID=UPI00203D85C0|nr:transglycosylase domain-containing protein [Mesobacillus subterraneus]MCM3576196.1 penicillin-binding protein [Mesobacillus subterraneus]